MSAEFADSPNRSEVATVSEEVYTEYLLGERSFEEALEALIRGAKTDQDFLAEGWQTLASDAILEVNWTKKEYGNFGVAGVHYNLANSEMRQKVMCDIAEVQHNSGLPADANDMPNLEHYPLIIRLGNSRRAQRVFSKLCSRKTTTPFNLVNTGVSIQPQQSSAERELRRRVYAGIVTAVRLGALSVAQLSAANVENLLPFVQLGRAELEKGLSQLDAGSILAAMRRAAELPPLSSTKKRRVQASPRRFIPTAPLKRPAESIEQPKYLQYTSWQDIQNAYQHPLTHGVSDEASDSREHWGLYYVDDLVDWPITEASGALDAAAQQLLQHSFIKLNGIPKIEATQLEAFTAQLPPDTPCLYFMGERQYLSFRSGREAFSQQTIRELPAMQTKLLNLIMLRILRTGRSAGEAWLERAVQLERESLRRHLFELTENATAHSGVLVRSSVYGDNVHRNLADNACIIDARPQ